MAIDYLQAPSPCYILEEAALRKNLELLKYVQEKAGVEIILAFKGFAMWSAFPMVRKYLSGATASSLNEARLCFEEMKVKAHTYAPAYVRHEFQDLQSISKQITFNSLQQYAQFQDQIMDHISCGLRVNPGYSNTKIDLYNPCKTGTRLGINPDLLKDGLPNGIEGLHFHSLCESNADDLEKALDSFDQRFGHLMPQVKWLNLGGGHLMTEKDYDVEKAIRILKRFKEKYGVEIILEPGSAIAWYTGVLSTTILDIIEQDGIKTAIIDASFTAHMPDTLEMPYRPDIVGASDPEKGKPTYRIGGVSCLAGDYLDEYSFEKALKVGDFLIFKDMMHYTMVKTTMFNGVNLPAIAIQRENGGLDVIREFDYEDFKKRLS